MKTILIPTDFSSCADRAVQTAFNIAKHDEYELHFLHLISTPLNWLQLSHEQQLMYKDVHDKVKTANDMLDTLVQKAEGEGVAAKKFLKYDESDQVILDHINNHDVNFVIMGSHGAHGIKEFFLGTNAQRIVRQSSVPVLITKHTDHLGDIKSIAFVSDFDPEMVDHFKPTLALAKMLSVKVRLVFINVPLNFTDTPTVESRMRAYAELEPSLIEAQDIYNFSDFEDAIRFYCAEHEISLLSMLTHGRKGLDRFFAGSLAESVINHVNLPVLSKNASA